MAAALAAPITTTVLFGVKTRPVGLGLTGSVMVPAVATEQVTLAAGPAVALYYYWYEATAQARVVALGGLGVFTLQGGLEPGWYLPIGASSRDWQARRFSLRGLTRGTLELNLRNDHFWLYSRTIGVARGHSFPEYDPYRDLTLSGLELSGEQAIATMVAPFGAWEREGRPKAYAWFYAEGIFNGLATGADRAGATDSSAHAGVILENVLPRWFIDLDGYYSFGPSPVLRGPGALVVVSWSG